MTYKERIAEIERWMERQEMLTSSPPQMRLRLADAEWLLIRLKIARDGLRKLRLTTNVATTVFTECGQHDFATEMNSLHKIIVEITNRVEEE